METPVERENPRTAEKKPVGSPSFPHRLIAGLGMVLLAIVWAAGWFTPPDPFKGTESPALLMVITATVIGAWTLLSAVIAAGFFHAASKHPAKTYRKYRMASLRLLLAGLLILFPGPVIAQVLGTTMAGRALALLITSISIATIVFGRARIIQMESHMAALLRQEGDLSQLEPWENIDRQKSPPAPDS